LINSVVQLTRMFVIFSHFPPYLLFAEPTRVTMGWLLALSINIIILMVLNMELTTLMKIYFV
jgi:hypothetical protein